MPLRRRRRIGALATAVQRAARIEAREWPSLAWSCAYFFFLLSSYYVIRPLREELGIESGVQHLHYLWTGTFAAMLAAVPLYSWLASRWPTRQFLRAVYRSSAVALIAFFLAFELVPPDGRVVLARVFYVFTSVFNLFVVSSFWSAMADRYENRQGRRLFGFISAGGTLGALVGSLATSWLATRMDPMALLVLAALLLEGACYCSARFFRSASGTPPVEHDGSYVGRQAARSGLEHVVGAPTGGSAWAGITGVLRSPYLLGISAFLFLYTLTSTFLHFEQAHMIADTYGDAGQRTAWFARINFWINLVALSVQVLLTGRLIAALGVGTALALLPALTMAGFAALGTWPLLAVLAAFQVLRSAGEFAIAKPAREVLFTVVSREDKYKSKGFIDTVVYRGGDALSAWGFSLLQRAGLGLSGLAYLAVLASGLWLVTGLALGREQERRLLRFPASRASS